MDIIRENLTTFRKSLYNEAKNLKNSLHYNFYVHGRNKIFEKERRKERKKTENEFKRI